MATMATMPSTPQHAPTSTGRRLSMDQGRPTEKPKKERFKGLKDRFRSNKHDENKGQDVNNDQTSEKDQNEINATRGDELPTSLNMILTRNGSLPLNGAVSSPARHFYPQNDSGYPDSDASRLPTTDLSTPGNRVPPSPAHSPGFKDGSQESTDADFQSQTHQSGMSPNGSYPSKPTVHQDRFSADDGGKQADSGPEPLPKDNQLSFAELFSSNRSLRKQLDTKEQEMGKMRQQRDNAETAFGQFKRDIAMVTGQRDEAGRKLGEVEAEYKKSIIDLNKRTGELRKATKDLEEGEAKWAKGSELEGQLQGRISDLQKELAAKDKAFEKWSSQFQELEKTYKHVCGELGESNNQLFKAQEDYKTIQEKHSETNIELMRMKIESRSDVDDAFFMSRYQNLQSDIRTWAQNYFWGEQRKMGVLYSPHSLRQLPSIHDDLEELSEDCLNLLVGSEDGSTRPFVAEAYLWKYLEDHIFHSSRSASSCSKGLFWAHKLRPEIARMEKFLHPGLKAPDAELRMFYKWKANTAKLVIRRLRPNMERTRIPVDPAVMDYMVTHVLHVLGEWMGRHEKVLKNEEACRNDLMAIIQAAIDFDSHIHEEWSRIFITAKPVAWEYRYGFPFKDGSMKPASDYILFPGELVGTVVSPALVRNGTSSGDFYHEVQEILVPSRVLPQGFAAKTQKPRNSQSGGAVMRGVQQRIRA